jgi:predicted Zn finger-like uncharacterized protein
MATVVHCPNCAASLEVPERLLGKKVRCAKCKATIATTLPNASQAPAPEPADPVQHGVSADAPLQPSSLAAPVALGPAPVEAADPKPAEPLAGSNGTVRKKRKRKKSKSAGLFGRIGFPAIAIEPGVLYAVGALVGAVVFAVVGYYGLRAAFRVPPPKDIPASQWQAFEVEGRCKVLFPGTPHRDVQAVAGMTMVMQSFQPDKNSVYGIGYSEGLLPPNRRDLPAEQLLNDSCDGSAANLANMGGKEVRRESVQLGPYPGKQLVIYIPQAGGHMISRCYLVGGRLYIIMVGGSGYDTGQNNVNRFFDSFEILDPGTPPPPPPPPPVAQKGEPAPPAAAPPGGQVADAKPRVPQPMPANINPPKEPEPPRITRLELPPLPDPLEIKPAPVTAETPYRLPEPVRALRVGGGGRFLVLHFPKARKLGIFDANEAKIVRYVPAGEDDVSFAAGMTKLVLLLPGAKVIQRYNLLTGEREHVGNLDVPEGKVESFCMGHASAGPLLVGIAGQDARLYDLDKFAPIPLPTEDPVPGRVPSQRLDGGFYWAGATGRVLGHTGNYGQPNGVRTVVFEGGRIQPYGVHQSTWFVMPGPDDHHVYAGGHGVISDQVKPVSNVPFSMGPNSGYASHLYLPAHHGPYYLHAETIGDPNCPVRIYMLGDKEPILTYPKTAVCHYGWDGLRGVGIEYSMHLVPKAKLLVVVPEGREELRLYPADLDAALDKLGRDYLLITSTPPTRFQKGKAFAYRTEVKAKRGPVAFKLEGAPAGMTVDANGAISWPVPADFADKRVDVILVATDSGGQDAFQTLTLTEGAAE